MKKHTKSTSFATLLLPLLLLLLLLVQQTHSFASFVVAPSSSLRQHQSLLLHQKRRPLMPLRMSSEEDSNNDEESNDDDDNDDDGIDVSQDDRLYRIRIPRAPGIEWGTDLSFSFVYVRTLDPTGPAAMSGLVEEGHQLCELKEDDKKPINLLGAPFDYVMDAFANLEKTTKVVELVFFKGSKEDLKTVCTGNAGSAEPELITITVIENKGSEQEAIRTLQVPAGSNIRQVCVDAGINVYQSVTRWTNCKGQQLCGTCIVNIKEGSLFTNRKSMDEASTLRENPDSYRLSCVAFAYGDVTVETFPPIEAAQWTR